MSVTHPGGFSAAGATAGLKPSGRSDLALVLNHGPHKAAAGVFTGNRIQAAPVRWSRRVLRDQALQAVILNSGGANACTGPDGFADVHTTAEAVASALQAAGHDVGPIDVAVCSTGLIGVRLPVDKITAAVPGLVAALAAGGGSAAAEAIMTTDTVTKEAVVRRDGWSVGGMAKGAAMLAPGLATMLVVITTDAVVVPAALLGQLVAATRVSFDRVDSDGCMSTNDTVLLMSSGASGIAPEPAELTEAVTAVCTDLARQLVADAEGSSHTITVDVINAATEADAVEVGKSIARNNLFKCAVFGNDPNWGRVLAAVGTTSAAFDPDALDVSFNGVQICRAGGIGEPRELVDLSGRDVSIVVDLHAGDRRATIWTTDLTYDYVRENAEYST
jgi:glutamate N-acetyltransferase/amino-acid N-acetyltransferase